MQFIHFKSASMFGLKILSNISLAPTAVKCDSDSQIQPGDLIVNLRLRCLNFLFAN